MSDTVAEGTVTEVRATGFRLRRLGAAVRASAPRFFKTGIAALILAYAASALLKSQVLAVSSEAVVAGSLVTLRAPIDGIVRADAAGLGTLVSAERQILTISNPWADDALVRDLRNRLQIVEAELVAIEPQGAALEQFSKGLRRGASLYQMHRVDQLSSLLSEGRALLEASKAQEAFTRDRLARGDALVSAGLTSTEQRAQLEKDHAVALQEVEATGRHVEALKTQLRSAQQGVNIDPGGVGADQPYSHQRLDEVTLELVRLRQRVEAQSRVRDALRAQLADAELRMKELSFVELKSSHRARVWQRFVASESYVNRGAPILSLINCDEGLVVAAVKERIYDKLKIGSPARFKLDGRSLPGRVVRLEGLSAASRGQDVVIAPGLIGEHDPIPASADPYRVTLEVPALAKPPFDGCAIGRPGEVAFGDRALTVAW